MQRILGVCLLAGTVACGAQNPTAPSAIDDTPSAETPAPGEPVTTVSGHLVALNGGQPLGGIEVVTSGVAPTVTDGSGEFAIDLPAMNPLAMLEFVGPSIVPRKVVLPTQASSVGLDAISLSGGFSLDFYRQLVRNSHESPAFLQPIRRWTTSPRVYLRTVFGDDRPIDESTLATVADTIRRAVSVWSGGTLSVAEIERGTGTREGQAGWITVIWTEALGGNICGDAHIGSNPGLIRLNPRLDGCRCAGSRRGAD